jgi:hypothetical protein
MSRYVLVVQSNAVSGTDADFNDWYDNVHLGEVLELAGFVAAERFQVEGDPVAGTSEHRYLALYELETDDPQGAMAALGAAAQGGMDISDTLDMGNVSAVLYSSLGERVTA